MQLIKELNEALIIEHQEITEDLVTFDDNVMTLLESDSRLVCDSAICFLNKFAEDIKGKHITSLDKKAKTRFAVYTALELLKVKQPTHVEAAEKPSIRKYLTANKDIEKEEFDDIEPTLVKVLTKLQNAEHVKGTKVKDHNISLFKDDPDQLLANVNKLKAKYRSMKSKM